MPQLVVCFEHGDLLVISIAALFVLHGRVQVDHILLIVRVLVSRARSAD